MQFSLFAMMAQKTADNGCGEGVSPDCAGIIRRHKTMNILEVKGLKKVYTTRFGSNQVTALRNVNFSVEKGEYVAIMGGVRLGGRQRCSTFWRRWINLQAVLCFWKGRILPGFPRRR